MRKTRIIAGAIAVLTGATVVATVWSSSATRPETPQDTPPPYNRVADFGTGWDRVRGACDTREVVLERDAGPAALDTDHDGCRDDGPIRDLYTDTTITPQQAQIDHVYSEGQAWANGAWRWTREERRRFSQDMGNLRAVLGTVNESKGDRGPAAWSPPAQSGWCEYGQIYRSTAERWKLTITPADAAALTDLARSCR